MPCPTTSQSPPKASPSLLDLLSSSPDAPGDDALSGTAADPRPRQVGGFAALSAILQESLAVLDGFEVEDDDPEVGFLDDHSAEAGPSPATKQ